jgi:hypothetical protein
MSESVADPGVGQSDNGGGIFEGSTETPEWINSLPEDIRTPEAIPTFSKYKGETDDDYAKVPKSLLKSHIEVQRMVGKKGVIIPDEKSTTQEREAFYEALGRPKSPQDYGFKKPDGIPDELGITDEKIKEYAETLHGLGLSKSQAAKLFDVEVNRAKAEHEASLKQAKETHEKAIAEYKKQYGEDFQKVDSAITQAVKTVGGDELANFLISTGLRDVPVLMNAFKKVSDMMGEHGFKDGSRSVEEEVTEEKLMEMMKDPRYNGGHKDGQYVPPDPNWHKKVKDGWARLYSDAP